MSSQSPRILSLKGSIQDRIRMCKTKKLAQLDLVLAQADVVLAQPDVAFALPDLALAQPDTGCFTVSWFCQSTSRLVGTVTDTGPFSCNWPGFNPAHPDVTPCGDDYLKVLLLEGWCPVTREWGHGKEPHDSNGLWPRGLWPLHWDNRNLCLQILISLI